MTAAAYYGSPYFWGGLFLISALTAIGIAMSRPTLLSQEIIDKAGAYVGSCDKSTTLPTIEGLALYLEITRSTLYLWEKVDQDSADKDLHEQFSDILEGIRCEQAQLLINGGLFGKFNSTITKLMLTKHGYADRVETDLTSKGEAISNLPSNVSDEFNEFLEQKLKSNYTKPTR